MPLDPVSPVARTRPPLELNFPARRPSCLPPSVFSALRLRLGRRVAQWLDPRPVLSAVLQPVLDGIPDRCRTTSSYRREGQLWGKSRQSSTVATLAIQGRLMRFGDVR